MKSTTFLAIALLALLLTTGVTGDPITIGETQSLKSELLDEERAYSIALPAGYSTSKARYPVLYLLGGGNTFQYTASLVRLLAHEDLVPPMIVVGVHHTRRTRDLTTPWTSPNPPAHMQGFIARGGGADLFVRVLTEEIAPHIDERYRTAPFRILTGRSLGGLFTLHTLFTAPEAFNGYIAISPSTHWNDGELLREVEAFFERESDGDPKFLFLSKADEGGDVLENYHRLVERLEYDAPTHLHWAQREFLEDDHGTSILPSMHRGLTSIFQGWRPPAIQQAKGLQGFDQHFARLSKRYGYEISVPESTINILGLRATAMGRLEEGIEILTQNTERYPESAYARYSLGTALEGGGQLDRAVAEYERAIALGKASDDPNLGMYQERLARLRK